MAASANFRRSNAAKCKQLPEEVRRAVRSDLIITSLFRCVEELVYNSIDAGGTDITIDINPSTFEVKVQDNGHGISKKDLEKIGLRYFTSKISDRKDLESSDRAGVYGFRGEALASITQASARVDIVSRCADSNDEYMYARTFQDGKPLDGVKVKKNLFKRHGLVVLVDGLLSRQVVRQKRVNESLQVEEIKNLIQAISLIHHKVSFTLRNRENSAMLLHIPKAKTPTERFLTLCKTKIREGSNFSVLEFDFSTLGYKISGYFCNQGSKQKHLQYLFVNNRPSINVRISKHLSESLASALGFSKWKKDEQPEQGTHEPSRSQSFDLCPMFVVKVSCPISEYFLTAEGNKSKVEFPNFVNMDSVLSMVKQSARNVLVRAAATQMSHGRKGKKEMGQDEQKLSQLSSKELLQHIKSKASIHDMKSALVSKPVSKPAVLPKQQNSISTRENRGDDDVELVELSSSSSSSSEVFLSQEVRKPLDNKPQTTANARISVLKPITSYVKPKNYYSLPKHSAYGKLRERTINTAAIRKRKKNAASIEEETKKAKVLEEPSRSDDVNAWIMSIEKARHQRQSQNTSGSPEMNFRSSEKGSNGSDEASVISHSLSRLSVTPCEPCPKPSVPRGSDHKAEHLSINVLDAHRKMARDAARRLSIPDASTTLKSKIHKQSGRSAVPPEVGRQIRLLQPNFVDSSQDLELSNLRETPFLYQNYTKREKESDEPDPPEFRGNFAGCSQPVFNSLPPKRRRLSDDGRQVDTDNFVQLRSVKQRDPRIQAKLAANKSHRNAVYFDSQDTDYGLGTGLQLCSQSKQNAVEMESFSQPHHSFSSARETSVNRQNHPDYFPLRPVTEDLLFQSPSNDLMTLVGFDDYRHMTDLNISPSYLPAHNVFLRDDDRADGDDDDGHTHLGQLFGDIEDGRHAYFYEAAYTRAGTPMDFASPSNSLTSGLSQKQTEVETEEEAEAKTEAFALPDENAGAKMWSPAKEIEFSESKSDTVKISPVIDQNEDPRSKQSVQDTERQGKLKSFRNKWLRSTFPTSCSSYWNVEEPRTTKENRLGDATKVTEDPNSLIGSTLKACLTVIHADDPNPMVKWSQDEGPIAVANQIRVPPFVQAPIRDIKQREILFEGKKLSDPQSMWHLSKECLKKIIFVGNADKKFIFAKLLFKAEEEPTTIVVCFDQHAVHERIRLEQLVRDAQDPDKNENTLRSRPLIEKITLDFNESEMNVIKSFPQEFQKLGLCYQILDDRTLQLSDIPSCFYFRLTDQTVAQEVFLCQHFIRRLIEEIVQDLIDTNGGRPDILPKTIMDELKLLACRGAIKFGDELSSSECISLLEQLQTCDLPFQCAHGRPTLFPLMELVN